MKILNIQAIYALTALIAGTVISLYSYELIATLAEKYFLLPYVFSRPIEEAVHSTDRLLAYVDAFNYVATGLAMLILAAAVYLGYRSVKEAGDSRSARMIGIVLITLSACAFAGMLSAMPLVNAL